MISTVPVIDNGRLGLIVGLLFGISGAFGGFSAFVIVLLLGAVDLLVGRYLDGQLEPQPSVRQRCR